MDEEIRIIKIKIEALETAISKLNEIQKRLIAALKVAKLRLKTYLLPKGTYHGSTIE